MFPDGAGGGVELFLRVGWGGGGGLEVPVIMQRQFQQSTLFDFLEEPQIQFIARVRGPSSLQRDGGLFYEVWRRCWGGHFSRFSSRPGVERQFSSPQSS